MHLVSICFCYWKQYRPPLPDTQGQKTWYFLFLLQILTRQITFPFERLASSAFGSLAFNFRFLYKLNLMDYLYKTNLQFYVGKKFGDIKHDKIGHSFCQFGHKGHFMYYVILIGDTSSINSG